MGLWLKSLRRLRPNLTVALGQTPWPAGTLIEIILVKNSYIQGELSCISPMVRGWWMSLRWCQNNTSQWSLKVRTSTMAVHRPYINPFPQLIHCAEGNLVFFRVMFCFKVIWGLARGHHFSVNPSINGAVFRQLIQRWWLTTDQW